MTRWAAVAGLVVLGADAPAAARKIDAWPAPAFSPRSLSAAIERAVPGDTVWVHPGLHQGTWDLRRGVSVIGAAGADSTVLDAAGGRYVLSGRDLDSTTVVAGLTLQHGRRDHPNSGGGGLYLHRSSPVVTGCVFREHLGYLGPGIYMSRSSHPLIAGNVFVDNEGYLGGALAAYDGCDPLVYDNVIVANRSVSGGGMLCLNSAAVIVSNTFAGNRASGGGGALYCDDSPAFVAANVLAGNADTSPRPGAVAVGTTGRGPTLSGNLLWENEGGEAGLACRPFAGEAGNCEGDPGFVGSHGTDAASAWARDAARRHASCAPDAGARAHGIAPVARTLAVPDSVRALWRVWRAAQRGR